jgi:KaiC/GvpD/RAD55 family RecA-like ATPase
MNGATSPPRTRNQSSASSSSSDEERIPSGIKELDRILGGGFPRGTFNCVEGDIGAGTSTFCIQAVWSRLSLGGLASFMCLDEPAETVAEHFESFGWNVKPYIEEKRLLLFDGHQLLNSLASASEGQNGQMKRKAILAEFLGDHRKIVMDAIDKYPNTNVPFVTAVDSFSSIAPYVDLKSAYVLAHLVANSVRKARSLFIAVVHTGALEANMLCACNTVADGIIGLEYGLARSTLKRVMRIEKMAFTPTPNKPLEYVITTKSGIEILVQDEVDEKPLSRGHGASQTKSRSRATVRLAKQASSRGQNSR